MRQRADPSCPLLSEVPLLTRPTISILAAVHVSLTRLRRQLLRRADDGQATAEYALVLLGAAVVAIALVTWATSSGRIGELFDAVFDELKSRL